jgi:hypothetical protein
MHANLRILIRLEESVTSGMVFARGAKKRERGGGREREREGGRKRKTKEDIHRETERMASEEAEERNGAKSNQSLRGR